MNRLPALLAPLALGCHSTVHVDANVLSFLQVSVLDELTATQGAPFAFTDQPVTYRVRVEALDRNADPAPFRGTLSVKTQPGDLISDDEATLVEGVWEGDVTLQYPFGPTHIWFTDDQGDDETTIEHIDHPPWVEVRQGRAPTFVSGVSDALWYELPTVAQVQAYDDHEKGPLVGEYTSVRCVDRRVIVLAVGEDGMWVTDLDDPRGDYNSLYIYTYNKPEYATPEGDIVDEELSFAEAGQRLASLGGGNQEYLATTQLAFPQYDFYEGEILEVPEPIVLEPDDLCSNEIMERFEGNLVRAPGLTVPDFDYGEGSDFYEYGQWPLEFDAGGCELYAETSVSVPEYAPSEHIGEHLDYIQGMLMEVWGKWIILPRDADDISSASRSRAPTSHPVIGPARPRARSRSGQPRR
ncbi:MAG: hypothetical protein ABIO70_03475 [Pseudomonadota bacterium]